MDRLSIGAVFHSQLVEVGRARKRLRDLRAAEMTPEARLEALFELEDEVLLRVEAVLSAWLEWVVSDAYPIPPPPLSARVRAAAAGALRGWRSTARSSRR
jgi:hypothetical protein